MTDPPGIDIRAALTRALSLPTAETLWRLRADLLERGLPPDAGVWAVIDEFRRYLDQLATSTSSREYSHLASKLDVAAVGGVVLEQAFESRGGGDLGFRILSGLLSEGLMVLATRQHVKAWEGELAAVYRSAAWYLYGELWRWAERKKPDLPAAERRRLLDALFEPVHSTQTGGFYKAVLLGHLFQMLLVSYLMDDAAFTVGANLRGGIGTTAGDSSRR
jgi:hypothetical protein